MLQRGKAAGRARDGADIVDRIVEEVGGDQSIREFVRDLMNGLLVLKNSPPLMGNAKVNEEYARRLLRRINKLEETLKAVPEGFPLSFLFTPERLLPLFLQSQVPIGRDATVEIAPELAEQILQEPEDRLEWLCEEMARLRTQCERIIQNRLGEHGNTGYPQERAAVAARELMERCGLPLTCSQSSKYCIIAGMFYEAMTGLENQDLRRACESMARSRLGTEKRPSR
jgi:hypothetical protein